MHYTSKINVGIRNTPPMLICCLCVLFLQLYNSFFVYQVTNKLKGAEKILLALGYSPRHLSSSTTPSLNESQELVYNGEVDINHVSETATDLVILLSDLEQLQASVMDSKSLHLHQPRLANILEKRIFDAVSVDSSSRGNSEIVHDPRVSSQLLPNVQVANYRSRNLDYLNGQTWGEDLERDQVPSQSSNYEPRARAINMQPLTEVCQYSSKHGSQDKSANICTRGLIPVDDWLHHPVDYSDSNLITVNSTSPDSLSSSFLQGIPCPNIEDLPEPIYNNEDEFSLEKGRFFGNSNQLSFVNPRSSQDAYDNSLIGRNFSLDEHASANYRERTDSCGEEVLCKFETSSHGAAEEISTGTRNNQSLPSRHGSLMRSQSYDPDLADSYSLPFNSSVCKNSPPVAVHRSDSDLTGSYVILSVGQRESSIETDSLNSLVYQSNSNQLPNFVKSKQRTGDGLANPRPETLLTNKKCNKKRTENMVLCEIEHTEDGFMVLDLCLNSNHKCSETRTSGETYNKKALEKVEWRTDNTTQASMWTCHFCTNINAMELLECEICGAKNSN